MKIDWKKVAAVFLLCLLVSIVFWGFFGFIKAQKNTIELACEFGKIKSIVKVLHDIERQNEHKNLCENQICINYFEEEISKNEDFITQIEEIYNCDKILGKYRNQKEEGTT